MITPRRARLRIVLLLALLISSGFIADSSLARRPGDTSNCSNADNANDPCFSKVTDILQGQRSLLPVDDLVTTYGQPNAGGSTNLSIIVSPTKNGHAPIGDASQYEISQNVAASATAVGRMFNLPRDVIVTATQGVVTVRDQGPPINVKAFPLTETPVPNGMTMADFNGDGFDDFVLAQTDIGNDGKWYGYLEFVTAKDVNDLNQGLNPGPFTAADFPVGANALGTASIDSGDFDGDGIPEVIVAWPVHGGATNPGIEIAIYRFSRQNGQFHLAGSTQFSPPGNQGASYTQVHILAGNFTGAAPLPGDNGARDQLALTWNDETTLLMASGHVDVDTSQTPATLTPVMEVTGLLGVGSIGNMTAARLNWLSNQEQIVFGFTSSWKNKNTLITLVFIGGKNGVGPTPIELGNIELTNLRGCATGYPDAALRDFAIGNYDQTDSSGTIEIPKTLQLSILYATYCMNDSSPNLRLNQAVYDIAFDDNGNIALSAPQDNGAFPLEIHPLDNQTPPDVLYSFPATLTTGDLQGRSLLLGAPIKATVNAHIQPDTILGLPPMHLDWVNPVGENTPSAVNVTVFPATYNAQYNFASSSSNAASRQSTTSFTYATDESAEQKISYGIPDIDSVSISLKEAAKQMYNNTAAKAFNTYSSESFDLSASTVFDDLIAATIKRLNIYSYPVIGHCIKDSGTGDSAAADNSACPAGERPLILQFSGPDQIIHLQPTEGAGLEWYQPPQQPGQVFSYPGSLAQLELEQEQPQTGSGTSDLQLLSGANSAWGSQGGNELVKVNWTQGNGSNVSAGSVSTHSFDVSVSVSGSANIEGLGLSGSASFAYNQSRSSSTLNTTATSFADSTGITLNRGLGPDATTTNAAYLYEGQSYIFGQLPAAGTIDDRTPAETVKGDGFITVGYAADPLSTSGIQSGNWWKQTYDLPDIALNHPQRWQQTIPQGTDGERVAFNCPIGFSSSFASPGCTPNGQTPTPANIATDPFYQMKGLFVTPGTSAEGPQITRVTAGDTVTLRARVYNYSLANLPAGSTVHMRFYAQPWDNQRGQFTAGSGPHGFAQAIYIGEDVLNPIPALCGGSSTGTDDPCTDQNAPLNWVYAKATWYTPALPDSALASYWKFWVVAFPENGGGVPEVADHGLTSVPPADVNSLADIPVQTYSNNLGFYNQVFSVVAKTAPSPGAERTPKTLTVTSVDTEKDGAPVTQVRLNDRVQVRADHHVAGVDLDDVLVLFYDGDPAQGGQLFDMENVPRIPADSDFVTRVPFQPRSCGLHTLFVKAISGDGTALPTTQQATLNVTMDPVAKLGRMSDVITRLQSAPGTSTSLPADWSLSGQAAKQVQARLAAVQRLFQQGQASVAVNRLTALEQYVDAQRGKEISVALADALNEDIKRLLDCASA